MELLSSPHVHCPQSSFEMLVLDEADRLLDLGFKDDLQKILRHLPKQRRTGLFSASISEAVDQIVRVGLRNPVKVAVKVKGGSGVEDKRTPARYAYRLSLILSADSNYMHSLQMTYLITPPAHKFSILKNILSSVQPTPQKTIFFVSTCSSVDYLSIILPIVLGNEFLLVPLHGKHPANVRQKNFTRFTTSTSPSILLTTDVASRGLDIPSVDLVVQIEPPPDPKTFIHRCGRAGRAGRRGLSIVLIHPGREEDYVSFLEVRKTPVTPYSLSTPVSDADAATATQKIRAAILKDRALHDKGQKAFVSWLRSYSKHQASSIFRVADLDWEALGKAWGLLRLPKMPELRNFTGDRALGVSLDWDNYAYKEKQREKRRREVMEENAQGDDTQQQDSKKRRAGESAAWSHKQESREKKLKRKESKKARKDRERWERLPEEEKQKVRDTERMVEEIRAKNEQQWLSKREEKANAKGDTGGGDDDEFEGFD